MKIANNVSNIWACLLTMVAKNGSFKPHGGAKLAQGVTRTVLLPGTSDLSPADLDVGESVRSDRPAAPSKERSGAVGRSFGEKKCAIWPRNDRK